MNIEVQIVGEEDERCMEEVYGGGAWLFYKELGTRITSPVGGDFGYGGSD